MKAVYLEKHGGPEVLTYGVLPDPVPKPGQILVDIHAASVNGADWKVRAGEGYGPADDLPLHSRPRLLRRRQRTGRWRRRLQGGR